MGKIASMDNQVIANELTELSLSRLQKIMTLLHEKKGGLTSELVKTMAQKITKTALNHLRQVGHKYEWRYVDCKGDHKGWVAVNSFRPFPFDMTISKVKRMGDSLLREIPSWWTGESWEGRKLKDTDEVVSWKLEPWGK